VTLIPFFTTCEEVERFVRMVDGRAKVVLLLETTAAVRLHEILAVSGIAEMMVGLNDLHLSIGLANPFALVASDFMTMVSDLVRARGIRFGFGRLARGGDDGLPIPSELD
jgi:2-keto-3-deoxy-L-rhamnonate aldolase RhmA